MFRSLTLQFDRNAAAVLAEPVRDAALVLAGQLQTHRPDVQQRTVFMLVHVNVLVWRHFLSIQKPFKVNLLVTTGGQTN